jgi:hypothetical protein
MSGTADTNGAIATPDGLFLDAGDPVGALYTRTVFSNLNHYADAIAPACVNWTSGPASVSARVVEPDGTLAAGVWYRLGVWGAVPGPVPGRRDAVPIPDPPPRREHRRRLHDLSGGHFDARRPRHRPRPGRGLRVAGLDHEQQRRRGAWGDPGRRRQRLPGPALTPWRGPALVREEGTVRDFGGDTSSVLTAWAAAKVYTQTTSPASTPQLAALHISQAVG